MEGLPARAEVNQANLELLESVLDNHFGNDIEAFDAALHHLESRVDELGTVWRRVGNNNIVFFTNERAAEVLAASPDTYCGIIVTDFDTRIEPGTHIERSILTNVRVLQESEIHNSRISYSHINKSKVDYSRINGLNAYNSEIEQAWLNQCDVSQAIVSNSCLTNAGVFKNIQDTDFGPGRDSGPIDFEIHPYT